MLNIFKNKFFFILKRYNYDDNKMFFSKKLIFIKFSKIVFSKSRVASKIIRIKYRFLIIKKTFNENGSTFLSQIFVYIKIIIKNLDNEFLDILKIEIIIFYNLTKNKSNKLFFIILSEYRELFSISI